MSDVVASDYVTYIRGRKMRRDGKECPPKPPETDDWFNPEDWLWVGYRVEMGLEYDKRKKVAEMLGMPKPEWREAPWPR